MIFGAYTAQLHDISAASRHARHLSHLLQRQQLPRGNGEPHRGPGRQPGATDGHRVQRVDDLRRTRTTRSVMSAAR
jgi:hypothetical protein